MQTGELTEGQLAFLAKKRGISVEELLQSSNGSSEGKEDAQPAEAPTGGVRRSYLSAGESSSEDISLESLTPKEETIDPYLLTLEEMQGDEEAVYDKISKKLKAVGIQTEEYIPGMDGIMLVANKGEAENGMYPKVQRRLKDDNREEILEEFNAFIKERADLGYADRISAGKEGVLQKHTEAISNVSIDAEEAQENYITDKISGWRQRETLDFGMGQRVKQDLKEGDFETPEEFAEYTKWKETGVVEPDTKTIESHRLQMEAEAKEAAGEKIVRNLDDEDKEVIAANVSKKKTQIDYRISNLEQEKKGIDDANNQLEAKLALFEKEPTQESLNVIRRDWLELNAKKEDFNNFVGALDSKEVADLDAAVRDFNKDYSLLNKLGVSFKKTAVDMGYGINQAITTLDTWAMGVDFATAAEVGKASAMSNFEDTLKGVEKEQARFSKGTRYENAFESVDNFASWAGNTAVQAIPSLTMAFTGSAAMPLFFISGFGSKAAEQAMADFHAAEGLAKNKELLAREDLDPETRAMLESQSEEYAKTLDMPAWREMSASAVSGAAEVLFERLGTMKILQGANKAINPLKPKIHKSIIKSANQEGMTEAATQIANNWADSAILGEDKNLFEGVMESYAGGALIGGPLELKGSMPAVFDNVAFSLMTRSEIKQYRNKIKKVSELVGIENLENMLDPNVPLPDNVSPEAAKLISELQAEGELLKDNAVNRIGQDLTEQDLMRVGEINIKMRRLNERFVRLAEKGSSAAELKAAEKTLREQFDELADEREAILTDQSGTLEANIHNAGLKISFNSKAGYATMFAREAAVKKKTSDIAFDKLDDVTKNSYLLQAKEEGKLASAEEIEKKAKEDYYVANNKKQLETDKQIAQKYLDSRGLKNKINSLDNTSFKQAAKQNNADPDSDAFITPDGDIFVNDDVAARNGRVGVYSHEVLHAISKDVLTDAGANQAGKELLAYMEQYSPETHAYVKARLDLLYEGHPAYYEEAMNALSDYIAEGNNVELNTLGQVNRFLNKVFRKGGGKELSLENGEATFAFIAQYANKNKNEKTKNIIQNFVRAARKGLDDEGTKPAKGVSKSSKSLLQDINDLVPDTVETQADFFDRKVFNPIYNDGKLHPAIANYIRSRSVSKEEADKIIESVADRLINFNPAAKRKAGDAKITFGEFLFANVNFGKLDARKALFEEGQERAQTESTDSEQAKQVVAAEASTTTQTEAPAYKNLVRRRVLAPEVVDTIKGKVKSVVRVMKTRMDAPVSKNVTVKPYIAEIKKAMGKQADIDFKKAMGGMKNNELKMWLLKNKAAILENMTTTWLMTAMPNAVQKKVDGQWTSDWKGKKIDRETVSTDSAGRTSGAEMVRRLPKAATRMSDAEYLSNFFNEDGSLIRGRKESLAKALAEEISFDILSEELQNPDSEIRQAFEQRQDLLDVALADNFVTQFVTDAERGNVKYSMTPQQINELRKHQDELVTNLQGLGTRITEARFRNALIKVYTEDNKTSLDEELLRKIAKLGATTANLYVEKIDDVGSAEFSEFIANGIEQRLSKDNLLEALDITSEDIFGSYENLGNEAENIQKNRAATLDYATQFVEKHGKEGVAKILRWMGGHTYTSSKIGGGRGQYYAGKADFYENVIAQIPGVTVEGNKVLYKGEVVEVKKAPVQKAYKTVNGKKVPKTEQDFANEYDERKEAADEAWEFMVDYLSFIRSKNDPVLWVATMKSLDSNMASMLKAAANVEYYHTGTGVTNVRYEHIIPTNYIMMQLTNHFWSKKLDLDMLRDKYSVAIIPTNMDENINLQYQSVMTLKWNYKKDPTHLRYYNNTTFGMNHMVPIKKIGGKDAGTIYGEKWAKFNENATEDAMLQRAIAIELLEDSPKHSKSVPRAVFMVGGPGAGKTNVGKGLKLGRRGYKVVNQDIALEPMKEAAGLPANEQTYTKEQRSLRAKLGAAARKAAQEKMDKYTTMGESMVVDGTGASYNATMKKIKALKEAGYEVSIVFANTSKAEAVTRNKARAERALPDKIVEVTWDAVQESAKLYKQEFGDKFYEINTNELKLGEDLPQKFLDKLYKDLDAPAAKYSKSLDEEFNKILEEKKGVASYKKFSRIQAQLRGKGKGWWKVFIHPSADDFRGLVHYAFAGKGKAGEKAMQFFEEKLMDPYFKGIAAIDAMRQQIKRDFKTVTKEFKEEYKMLSKQIGDSGFTYDHAIRVYMWDRQGTPIEGLSKRDKKLLLDAIEKNPQLVTLADALLVVGRRNEWPDPVEYWEGGSVLSDLNSMTEKVGRKKFLDEFIQNAEVIFSEENLNKIEALYGRAHREAIEDALYAMKNGTNRPSGANRQVNKWLNWINGSTGAIMFFNRRSALLQMLSFTNFINWSDNNPVKAAAAFGNQKQYWKDWAMIFNSDKLKERRGGLKQDVSDSEIADVAGKSKNSPQAILAYLLKIGFTPTQIADSMAIATGGATFYRNRVNKYLKEGMDKKAAEEQAWLDFSKKSDEAQQSSDPALVSQQQRSVLGRLVLAFANTPMQYTRLMKKAGMDLINGRGNALENISKIAYYGVVQNFIFSALQSALFGLLFDDDEPDDEKAAAKDQKRIERTVNSMIDTVLRGSGVYGAVAATIKNTILEYHNQEKKGFLADHTYTVLSALNISPPIGSKARKMYSAIQTKRFEKDNVAARGWGLTVDGKLNIGPNYAILGNLLSATTNVPLDRVVDELKSISEALDSRNKAWQRIALALGWKTWDVGVRNEEADLIKLEAKEKRKKEGIEKAKKTRQETNARKRSSGRSSRASRARSRRTNN